jgi:transcriptional regulator of arginine metabolism
MRVRNHRLLTIRNILSKNRITNQEELIKRLREEGYNLTQATLSRDLKYLGAGKVPDSNKEYIYILSGNEPTESGGQVQNKFPVNGYVSLEFAHNMGVMKVLPGFASSIASAIDQIDSQEILGTIAGDDTILIIPREGILPHEVRKVLVSIIPELK